MQKEDSEEDMFTQRTDEALRISQLNAECHKTEEQLESLRVKHKEEEREFKVTQRNYGTLHEKHRELAERMENDAEMVVQLAQLLKIKSQSVSVDILPVIYEETERLIAENLKLELDKKLESRPKTSEGMDDIDPPESESVSTLQLLEEIECENKEKLISGFADLSIETEEDSSHFINAQLREYISEMEECKSDLEQLRIICVSNERQINDHLAESIQSLISHSNNVWQNLEQNFRGAKNIENATLQEAINAINDEHSKSTKELKECEDLLEREIIENTQLSYQAGQYELKIREYETENRVHVRVCAVLREKLHMALKSLVFSRSSLHAVRSQVLAYRTAGNEIVSAVRELESSFHDGAFTEEMSLERYKRTCFSCESLQQRARPQKRLTFDVSTSSAPTPVPKHIHTEASVVIPEFLDFLDRINAIFKHIVVDNDLFIEGSLTAVSALVSGLIDLESGARTREKQQTSDIKRTVTFLSCTTACLNEKCERLSALQESTEMLSSLTQSPKSYDRTSRFEREISQKAEKKEKEAMRIATQTSLFSEDRLSGTFSGNKKSMLEGEKSKTRISKISSARARENEKLEEKRDVAERIQELSIVPI